ncbi:hypothetical protein JRQ81_012262 [Phrynocephalus forsythii]|uniref:Kinesin-like protein n=1 Tax=Phrynocephalus forsythii TaxID=171643 RepID=A0A9Q0X5W8_9SAUR|nr:hypothetical protein JRQ81_012262 [Phrynocephalus forsythii]
MEGQPPPSEKSLSRLPVSSRRPKRPAPNENEPPQPVQKRARVPANLAKRGGALSLAASQPKAPPAAPAVRNVHRVSGRLWSSSRAGAAAAGAGKVAATSTGAAAAGGGAGGAGKRRAPWDLKGQVSDLQAKVASYKEKVQGLVAKNEALEAQLEELRGELSQATGQKEELSLRASTLAADLEISRAQARDSLRRALELQAKEEELEGRVRHQATALQELERAHQEVLEAKAGLAVELETTKAALHLAQNDLAQHGQENQGLRARVSELEQKLNDSEMARRQLHNTVQELKGNIRVFCRVRPLLSWEKEAHKEMSHLSFPAGDNKSLVLSRKEESHTGRERKEEINYEFNFDRVFPPSSSQEDVFEEISLLVQSALDGYHVCIFAYGQTGSGKTYTMEGPDDVRPETAGMIPRAVKQVFAAAREMEAKGWKYEFVANFLEIYNESLRDLLVSRPEPGSELEIRRMSQYTEELHVPNLSYIPVSSEQEVLKLLQRAKANRSVAKTGINERSSRSHSLFQLRIEGQNARQELSTSSVLSLVDLAGSERLDKSLSKAERLKETQAINTSLSCLGLVITALSNKDAHIPYRNSKLTYLLQNSLGGSSKMLMFVNISPLEENFGESLNSLRFARKVNECVIGTATTNRK